MRSLKSALFAAAFAVAAVAAVPAFAATNLVADGQFSTSGVGTGWGEFTNTPWTNLSDSGVEIGYSPIYGLATVNATGTNLEVNANTFGDVVQTLDLTGGVTYELSYLYGGRPGGGPQTLDVSLGTLSFTNTGSFGYWTGVSGTFTAPTTGAYTLEFKSEATSGNSSYGNEITNVSVAAVPEPASWALMLLGVGGVGGALRLRRRATKVAA